MKVQYRQAFLKDLKKLKNQPIYHEIFTLVFTTLPEAKTLQDVPGVKALAGAPKRYRLRLGQYLVGIAVEGDTVEVMPVLHRRDFYRYFP